MNIVLIGKLWELPAACVFPHFLAPAKDTIMWAVIHAWVCDVMNSEIHVSEQFICKLGSSDVHIAAENVSYWSHSTRIQPGSKRKLVAEFHKLVYSGTDKGVKVVILISKISEYSSFMVNPICKQNYWALSMCI